METLPEPGPPSRTSEASLIENAEVHRSRVQINSAVMRMLLLIEFHRGLLLCRPSGTTYTFRMVDPSTKPALGGGLNQYHAAVADRQKARRLSGRNVRRQVYAQRNHKALSGPR